MKRGGKMLVFLAGSLALCTAATARTAAAADNPYQGIVERNVFGLKPPAPPPDPEANKPPPPKITLTGITTILGNKRALMKMTPPAKPGEPAKEQSFTLAEGERDGGLEVLEIDEKAGTVKVSNYGTVATLDFENNGVKTAPAAAPGGVPPPGMPPQMRAALPVPGAMGGAGMGATPVPPRPLRLPGGGASVTPQAAGGTSLASANVGVNPLVTSPPRAAEGGSSSPEEYALLLEFNRIRTQPLVDAGQLPPLPPHPMQAEARAAILGSEPEAAATPAPQ